MQETLAISVSYLEDLAVGPDSIAEGVGANAECWAENEAWKM